MRTAGVGIVLALLVCLPVVGYEPLRPPTPAPPAPRIPVPAGMPPTATPPVLAPAGKSMTARVAVSELEDFALKTEKLIVNNLSITPDSMQPAPGMAALKVSACYRNRTAERLTYSVVLVGVDGGKEVLWASNLKGMAEGNGVGVMQDVVLVPQGIPRTTTTVQVRAYTGAAIARPMTPSCYPLTPTTPLPPPAGYPQTTRSCTYRG